MATKSKSESGRARWLAFEPKSVIRHPGRARFTLSSMRERAADVRACCAAVGDADSDSAIN
eukprot:scaffold21922_cov32-Tisochrysis_lutea.AAC.2